MRFETPGVYGEVVGVVTFSVYTYLEDYISISETLTVHATFTCPGNPMSFGTPISANIFTHEFSDAAATWPMTEVTDIGAGTCHTFTTSVRETGTGSGSLITYLVYSMLLHTVTTDIYYPQYASLID